MGDWLGLIARQAPSTDDPPRVAARRLRHTLRSLVDLNIIDVPPVPESSEVALHQGILNGEATVVWFEVSFGHIRLMLGSAWQYVIPRTVLGWSRTRHGFVPFLGSLKVRIDIDDYASVIEQFVPHYVTN